MDTLRAARLARGDQGYHETEVSFGGECDLHRHLVCCSKHPGHAHFIPVTQFGLEHLPEPYKDPDVVAYIKAQAELTVRVTSRYSSHGRPDGYSFSKYRGRSFLRTGTGFVQYLYRSEERCNKPCPCPDCKASGNPKKNWYKIKVKTATHVVYDDKEAKNTIAELFYDEESDKDTRVKKIYGDNVRFGATRGDWCDMRFVTHDLELCDYLKDVWGRWRWLEMKINEKYRPHIVDGDAIQSEGPTGKDPEGAEDTVEMPTPDSCRVPLLKASGACLKENSRHVEMSAFDCKRAPKHQQPETCQEKNTSCVEMLDLDWGTFPLVKAPVKPLRGSKRSLGMVEQSDCTNLPHTTAVIGPTQSSGCKTEADLMCPNIVGDTGRNETMEVHKASSAFFEEERPAKSLKRLQEDKNEASDDGTKSLLHENIETEFNDIKTLQDHTNGAEITKKTRLMYESYDAKVDTTEAKINETYEAKVNETNEAKVNKTIWANVNETNEAKVNETNWAKVNEASEVEVKETKLAKANDSNVARINETNETKEIEPDETKGQETICLKGAQNESKVEVMEALPAGKSNVEEDPRLVVIVSHPHGCNKQVTVGQWVGRYVLDSSPGWENCVFTYDTPTCPGSSGAPVWVLGGVRWGGFFGRHPHSGRPVSGLNVSAVGWTRAT